MFIKVFVCNLTFCDACIRRVLCLSFTIYRLVICNSSIPFYEHHIFEIIY